MKKLDTDRIVQLILQKRAEQEPPKRTRPFLVVAPSYHAFVVWCEERGLNFRVRPFEAVHIYRPEHLFGRDNLTEDLVVVGYPHGNRGEAIQETVEALLTRERERSKEQ